jgi:predicted phosphodiesterase
MKHFVNSLFFTLVFLVFGTFPTLLAQTNALNASTTVSGSKLLLPDRPNSVKFLAFGDQGRGNSAQNELAKLMVDYRKLFPYDFALLMGDNIYGSDKAADMKTKFEDVYKTLLNDGVKFYATLGNHDASNQRFYEFFNMNGEEYHKFERGEVSFYCLNSNYMDEKQIKWLEDNLANDKSKWKIAFFHHPPYSSGGRHGSDKGLRKVVEPIFIKYKVDVVLAGHEHFYERLKPQNGVYYFITGAGGKISSDLKKNSPMTDKGFDTDLSFMLIEIDKNELYYQVVSRKDITVDSGVITKSE